MLFGLYSCRISGRCLARQHCCGLDCWQHCWQRHLLLKLHEKKNKQNSLSCSLNLVIHVSSLYKPSMPSWGMNYSHEWVACWWGCFYFMLFIAQSSRTSPNSCGQPLFTVLSFDDWNVTFRTPPAGCLCPEVVSSGCSWGLYTLRTAYLVVSVVFVKRPLLKVMISIFLSSATALCNHFCPAIG